jgi:hypothetical protein
MRTFRRYICSHGEFGSLRAAKAVRGQQPGGAGKACAIGRPLGFVEQSVSIDWNPHVLCLVVLGYPNLAICSELRRSGT